MPIGMPASIPLEMRQRIVLAYDQGTIPAQIARDFRVCDKFVRRILAKAEIGLDLRPGVPTGGGIENQVYGTRLD